MRKITLITFIFIFISNLGLISYASESDTNKFILEQQYKKDFLISDNINNIEQTTINSNNIEETNISPYIWMLSLLFPGLAHFALGETKNGVILIGSSIIFLGILLASFWSMNNINLGYGSILLFLGIAVGVLGFVVMYIISLINSIYLTYSIKNKIEEKDLRQNKKQRKERVSNYDYNNITYQYNL